jgi:hypothetical protein
MRRNQIFLILALVVGAVVGCYAVISGLLLFLAEDGCANQLLSETPSPDNRLKAVVFQRDCGATTDFSTQVSIIAQAEKLPKQAGNAFSADTNHGAAPSGPGGGPTIKVQWRSPAELLISHHPAVRVFKVEPLVGSIRVRDQSVSESGAAAK